MLALYSDKQPIDVIRSMERHELRWWYHRAYIPMQKQIARTNKIDACYLNIEKVKKDLRKRNSKAIKRVRDGG